MARKALGRGLSALLHEVETASTALEQVPVSLIDPNPSQPRRTFPEAALGELADSIRVGGLIQPVLLRRADLRYQLVVGERRWRAARLAGLESVPAVVRELNDREVLELALTENLQREDLNPLDVAHAFEALQESYRATHDEIAERVGINRSTVTNTLRLLRLPLSVQQMLANGEISSGHARALLGLASEAAQSELAGAIAKQGLSVRRLEALVAQRENKSQERLSARAPSTGDANTRAAILELERTLGTRVKMVGTAERGRIEIRYFSAEDLNRIYDWILRR